MTGEEIKQIRLELGLNQQEFANLLNAGKTTIVSWERNIRNISDLNKLKITNYLKKIGKLHLITTEDTIVKRKKTLLNAIEFTDEHILIIQNAVLRHEKEILNDPIIAHWLNYKLLERENEIRKEFNEHFKNNS